MTLGRVILALAGIAAIGGITPAMAAGDAAHGKVLFNQCLICHTIEPGKSKIGPSLFGVVGRPGASQAGYQYSNAMKDYAQNVVNKDDKGWTDEKLFTYLESPQTLVR
ncbi:MAG TPA: c-type cytochrome, partial [Variovorax sp.]